MRADDRGSGAGAPAVEGTEGPYASEAKHEAHTLKELNLLLSPGDGGLRTLRSKLSGAFMLLCVIPLWWDILSVMLTTNKQLLSDAQQIANFVTGFLILMLYLARQSAVLRRAVVSHSFMVLLGAYTYSVTTLSPFPAPITAFSGPHRPLVLYALTTVSWQAGVAMSIFSVFHIQQITRRTCEGSDHDDCRNPHRVFQATMAFSMDCFFMCVVVYGAEYVLYNLRVTVNRLLVDLQHTYASLRETATTNERMVASVAHELRTPLTSVVGGVELARERLAQLRQIERPTVDQVNAAFRDVTIHLHTLLRGAEMLQLVVEDIGAYVDTTLSTLKYKLARVDTRLLVEQLVGRHRNNKVQVLTVVSPDVPFTIEGDGKRLLQLFRNLLNNAVQYTREGCIVFRVTRLQHAPSEADKPRDMQCIGCRLNCAHCVWLSFNVMDTGIGMNTEDVEKAFKSYAKLSANSIMGLGLGLSISKELSRAMGGFIYAEGILDRGFSVTCLLPFHEYSRGQPRSAGTMVTPLHMVSVGRHALDTWAFKGHQPPVPVPGTNGLWLAQPANASSFAEVLLAGHSALGPERLRREVERAGASTAAGWSWVQALELFRWQGHSQFDGLVVRAEDVCGGGGACQHQLARLLQLPAQVLASWRIVVLHEGDRPLHSAAAAAALEHGGVCARCASTLQQLQCNGATLHWVRQRDVALVGDAALIATDDTGHRADALLQEASPSASGAEQKHVSARVPFGTAPLPIDTMPSAVAAPVTGPRDEDTAQAGASECGIHVMLIEDTELVSEVFVGLLTAAAPLAHCTVVATGERALDLFEQSLSVVPAHGPFDLLVVDYTLLGSVDGAAVIRLVRQLLACTGGSNVLQRAPIIVSCTAHATESIIKECMQAGADGVFVKPMHFKDMRLLLQHCNEWIRGMPFSAQLPDGSGVSLTPTPATPTAGASVGPPQEPAQLRRRVQR